ELGDKRGIANSLNSLGNVAQDQGKYEEARTLLQESLTISRELDDKRGIAISLDSLGTLAYAQGEYEAACARYHDSLPIRGELGSKEGIAENLEGLAGVLVAGERREQAARLLGAAAALREALGVPPWPHEREKRERWLSEARAALGDAAFVAAWQAGRAISV